MQKVCKVKGMQRVYKGYVKGMYRSPEAPKFLPSPTPLLASRVSGRARTDRNVALPATQRCAALLHCPQRSGAATFELLLSAPLRSAPHPHAGTIPPMTLTQHPNQI